MGIKIVNPKEFLINFFLLPDVAGRRLGGEVSDTSAKNKKLGVVALAAVVVSAMVGGGIFSLPQNMSQNASVIAVIIAWIITGIGVFFIANTFRTQASDSSATLRRRPKVCIISMAMEGYFLISSRIFHWSKERASVSFPATTLAVRT